MKKNDRDPIDWDGIKKAVLTVVWSIIICAAISFLNKACN